MKSDEILDCFGLLCPMPIIKTAEKVKTMDVGKTLEVIASDIGIKTDMPAWCKATGQECLGVDEKNGEFHAFVKKLK